MIELRPVPYTDAKIIYTRLLNVFIEDEVRDYDDFRNCMLKENYTIYDIISDDTIIGFIGIWDLDTCCFVEHFAIKEEFRSNGLGGRVLNLIKEKYKQLILEVEIPKEVDQIRRVNFYGRHGFRQNEFEYFQPPYRTGGKKLPLRIMSFPDRLPDDSIIDKLYREIYRTDRASVFSHK